ncbi:Hypothetical protein PBC10988_0430 [Planctomycetales bacterium 10988]|nr:Hypothetical protein PBC10988_0430 [Planctomycetales bacterium 10988]
MSRLSYESAGPSKFSGAVASQDQENLEYQNYRELNPTAVVSLLFGVISIVMLMFVPIITSPALYGVVPILGLLLGGYSWWKIQRDSQEIGGKPVALVGMVCCLASLSLGWGWMGYVYMTEVPEGYLRLSYAELQPGYEEEAEIPATAIAYDEKPVFIKGYVYPDMAQSHGLRRFVLCRDNGECCFGGQPKLTDMIQVTLKNTQTLDYHPGVFKVTGQFRVQHGSALHGLGQIYYHLDEAELH